MPNSTKARKRAAKNSEKRKKSEGKLLDKEAVEVETEEEIGKEEFGRENP